MPNALVPKGLNHEAVRATLMTVHRNCQHGTDAHRLGRLSIRFGPQRQVGKRFHREWPFSPTQRFEVPRKGGGEIHLAKRWADRVGIGRARDPRESFSGCAAEKRATICVEEFREFPQRQLDLAFEVARQLHRGEPRGAVRDERFKVDSILQLGHHVSILMNHRSRPAARVLH